MFGFVIGVDGPRYSRSQRRLIPLILSHKPSFLSTGGSTRYVRARLQSREICIRHPRKAKKKHTCSNNEIGTTYVCTYLFVLKCTGIMIPSLTINVLDDYPIFPPAFFTMTRTIYYIYFWYQTSNMECNFRTIVLFILTRCGTYIKGNNRQAMEEN